MNVCFAIDDFIFETDKSMWVADLSDGTSVYQDDNRPGLEPVAWLRLRDYLYAHDLHITRLLVKFRSHTEVVGSSEYGYFFRRGVLGVYGSTHTTQRYVFGLLNERNEFDVQTWTVPEIILDELDGHTTRPNENLEDCVIYNNRFVEFDKHQESCDSCQKSYEFWCKDGVKFLDIGAKRYSKVNY